MLIIKSSREESFVTQRRVEVEDDTETKSNLIDLYFLRERATMNQIKGMKKMSQPRAEHVYIHILFE